MTCVGTAPCSKSAKPEWRPINEKHTETSLLLRIVSGTIIGVLLALTVTRTGWIGIPGTLFFGALKAIAPVLVAVLGDHPKNCVTSCVVENEDTAQEVLL